jgi:hypothetical protein
MFTPAFDGRIHRLVPGAGPREDTGRPIGMARAAGSGPTPRSLRFNGGRNGDGARFLRTAGSNLADQAIHDVAIKVLMTMLGLGVDESEPALQDLVFPAEPFAG